MAETSTWLSMDAAATHLGISRSTLYRLVKAGTLRCYGLNRGRRNHFRREELDAALVPKPVGQKVTSRPSRSKKRDEETF